MAYGELDLVDKLTEFNLEVWTFNLLVIVIEG